MEFGIAKMSTKGQIVIPRGLRSDLNKGQEFLIVKDKGRLILKKMEDLAIDLIDDLKFAEKVEKAWQKYDKGKFIKKSKEEFLKELQAC
ncbi:AbrB/MazE/SpoVT family DNA-binding domain-containing protein [Candidatus Woesearchaeota archaeon]|nr:AbrB/MazE/SpoVT family DNA-binding domain-containing protein [Candidatus Woesearchaeota archaeon]